MPVVPAGSINPNAVLAPGVVVIQQLPQANITGVPTNIIGIVGTATWGPSNAPTLISSISDYVTQFGIPQVDDEFDLGSQVLAATSVGANALYCVRVTDGTDVKADVDLMDIAGSPAIGATLTAKYSGTVGNTLQAIVGTGSNSTGGTPTFKLTIGFPTGAGNNIPEVYDNIGGTGATFWANLVAAVNNGQSTLRGPSQLVTSATGAGTAAPDLDDYTFTSGTNGNSGVDEADLVGVDTAPRTGMYALRSTGLDMLVLCGATTSTNFAAQAAFCGEEGAYAILSGPESESDADSITAKKTAGLDSVYAKLLVGDWIRIQDNYNNGLQRYITAQGIVAGLLSTLSPELSGLNKQINSTVMIGTQSSDNNQIRSSAEIVNLLEIGIDVIGIPSPGGFYFALQTGRNSSLNRNAGDDGFTRLSNFIAESLSGSLGNYIGELQTPTVRLSAKTAIQAFLQNLSNQGQIGAVNGGPAYTVVLDTSNNPSNRVALGYMQADVQVAFYKVIITFLVNLTTGLVTLDGIS